MGLWRGGGENFDLNVAKELARKNYIIEFIIGCKKSDKNFSFPFKTYKIYSPYLDKILNQMNFHLPGIGKIWLLDKFLWECQVMKFLISNKLNLKKRNYYGILINGLPILGAWLATYIKEVPVIVMFHGPPDILYYPVVKYGKFIPASVGHAFYKIKRIRNDAEYLPLGIDLPQLSLEEILEIKKKMKKKLKIPPNYKIILYVGRLIKIKQLHILIKVVKYLKENFLSNFKLILVGDGPEKVYIQKLITNLNLEKSVYITGFLSKKEIYKYYSVADVFVLTSKYDNFPTVILEAMSYYLPVVTFKVGGIPLQIENKRNGFLIEPGNFKEFANRLFLLLKNDKLAHEIGLRNFNKVKKNYQWKVTAERVINILRKYHDKSNNKR